MPKYREDPERGSNQHATVTLIRNYHHDLEQITDTRVHKATIDAMVKRIEDGDKKAEQLVGDLWPRIRVLEARCEALPEVDPQRQRLDKELDALGHEMDRRRRPLWKAMHKDLDKIVAAALEPFRERQRALLKNVDAVGKSLRARELAADFKVREETQRQPGKDRDRGR